MQVRLRPAAGPLHAALPLRGGAGGALRARARARPGRREHGVGGPRGLPALARAAGRPAAQGAAGAAALRTPRPPQGARLQPPHAQTVVRPQTQAASTTFHANRISRRISLLDLTLRYVYS